MRTVIPPDLHPLVRKALRALKPDQRLSYRPELDDKLLRTPRGFIQIAVAREHTERAGRLLDMFVRTIEGPDVRGRVLFLDDKTMLEVDGEQFRLRFKEENARTPHRPTPEERRKIAAHPHFHSVPKADHHPTNRFTLELYDPNVGYRYRARLADRRRATLEQALVEVPALLRRLVQENRDAEVERERRRRAWEEQERQETEERQRREREKARRAELLADARAWREASLLRDYTAAVLQARGPDDEAQQRWATWARSVANEMDPLTRNGSEQEGDS
ncbi:hypothetical protein A2cp1_1164 [Anaeromyxobacter dehalogenans 2CP-1]|uniref:Uncharacterized protein n=1 Tax=Anaeromyxobacter dehalogenans (strain ATCC BAA-258 / DSM 21875 / 2CP-1) TaxID=455488 RepID=B8JFS1_ANAD2|nr:hypothetical protein A2cp1_1164 [Anaeromyxobacter dehalogenans 2CP-1]